MSQPRPLWGFGWAGWVLLPVALGLGWACLVGYDLRFKFLELINNTLGTDAVYWTVLHPIYHQWITVDQPGLGVWALVYVPVALHIHPRRSAWWWLPLTAWAILRPELLYPMLVRPGTGPAGILIGVSAGLLDRDSAAIAVCGILDAAVLAAATRSVLVVGVASAATVGVIAWAKLETMGGASIPGWFDPTRALLWNAALAGALLWWAVRARLKYARPGICKACGYDLHGLAEARCPECGAAFVNTGPGAATAPEPPSRVHSTP